MKKHFRYLRRISRLSLLKAMAYPINFLWFFCLAPVFLASEMLGYYFLFTAGNIETVAGFSLAQIVFVSSCAALISFFCTLFTILTDGTVTSQIVRGEIDHIYLKPLHSFIMIWGQQSSPITFILLLIRIAILMIVIIYGPIILSFHQLLETIYIFFTSIILLHCVYISSEALAFWFPNLDMNEYTYLCTHDMLDYPSSIYPSFFRNITTYIFPFFLISNPLFLVLNNSYTLYDALLTLVQIVIWVTITALLWIYGQRRYTSAS